MTTIQLASKLIRVFEGVKLTAYQDSGGVWTIGFGHTKDVTEGQIITIEQAEAFLDIDANPLLSLVIGTPVLKAAALVSFGYNSGYTSLKHVLAGTANLSDFVHDRHGNVLQGLVARRGLEASLIQLSDEQSIPVV